MPAIRHDHPSLNANVLDRQMKARVFQWVAAVLLIGLGRSSFAAVAEHGPESWHFGSQTNIAGDTVAALAPAGPIADSVDDFSGVQGLNGWEYGYWDESEDVDGAYDQTSDFRWFESFGNDPINGLSSHSEFTTGDLWYHEDGRYYTSLWAEGGHPHGTMDLGSYARANQWVVRRWTSTISGPIEISGHAGKVMPWGANWGGSGQFLIIVGGEKFYAAEVDDGGQAYSVRATVDVGTPVDFLIGPGSAVGVMRFTARLARP